MPEDSYSISIDAIKGFVLTNEYTGATISIPDFITNPQNYRFNFNGLSEESSSLNNRNIIEGTAEDDYYEPGDGFNIFYGGEGNDTLAGGKDMDFMYGGTGDDTLLGRNGVNVLFGEGGSDTIYDGNGGSYLSGGEGDDFIYGGGDADVLDGGTGIDTLCGGNGEDTYVFAKGYEQDIINEWGNDHSFVYFKDINYDEVTISDQWGSNLIVAVNEAEDVLSISNFKWGQATFTFRFTDGAEDYVNKDTWQLVLTKQPDFEEDNEA